MNRRSDLQNTIKKAMADLRHPWKKKRDTAIQWFMSSGQEEGSFLWICSRLNVKPGQIRGLVEKSVTRRVMQRLGGSDSDLRFRFGVD